MNHDQKTQEPSLISQIDTNSINFQLWEQTRSDYHHMVERKLSGTENIASQLMRSWQNYFEQYGQTMFYIGLEDQKFRGSFFCESKKFFLLDEIEELDFDNYEKLITAFLKSPLKLTEAFEMTLASGSKENILTLFERSSPSTLIASKNLPKFFEMIIFRHGNAMAKKLWDNYLSNPCDIQHSTEFANVLSIIIQSQWLNIKRRRLSERNALDLLCAQIASYISPFDLSASVILSNCVDLLRIAAYWGLEKTISKLLSHNHLVNLILEKNEDLNIALQINNLRNNEVILKILNTFFGSDSNIHRRSIRDQLRVLHILVQTMNTSHPRTLEFKNKIEEMSNSIFDSAALKHAMLNLEDTYEHRNVANALIQLVEYAIISKNPYFVERSLYLWLEVRQRLTLISNLRDSPFNLTGMMTVPSCHEALNRINHAMVASSHNNSLFRISFSEYNSPLFGSKAILAINNLFSEYVIFSSESFGWLIKGRYINCSGRSYSYDIPPLEGYANSIAYSVDAKHYSTKTTTAPDSIVADEVFCMNLAVMADTFLTTKKERKDFLSIINQRGTLSEGGSVVTGALKDFFLSSYQKGCSLWVWNHLMQRQNDNGFKAIKCFQQVVESQWEHDLPYHNVWVMSVKTFKNPGFKRAHDKYERLATKLEEIRPGGLHFRKR